MKKYSTILLILFFINCGNKSVNVNPDFSSNFEKAVKFLIKENFLEQEMSLII